MRYVWRNRALSKYEKIFSQFYVNLQQNIHLFSWMRVTVVLEQISWKPDFISWKQNFS